MSKQPSRYKHAIDELKTRFQVDDILRSEIKECEERIEFLKNELSHNAFLEKALLENIE